VSDLTEPRGILSANGPRIFPASTPEQIQRVRELFREYADTAGASECFEGFGREISGLPCPYHPPGGQLLLAELEGQPVGCAALRQLDEGVGEMKRLFVRPAFRTRQAGRQLAETLIAEARRIGYRTMRLDTLPSMVVARALYQSLGFRVIPRYNDNPGPGVLHLELKL
jgi:ribosomal protein S18 acetylase RimI-like enzyme